MKRYKITYNDGSTIESDDLTENDDVYRVEQQLGYIKTIWDRESKKKIYIGRY